MARIGWLARGQLHTREADGRVVVAASAFLDKVRERHSQIERRNAWKQSGDSAAATMARGATSAPVRAVYSAIVPAEGEQRSIYALDTGAVGGLFAELEDGGELRLFHTERFRIRCLGRGPDGLLVASITDGPFAHIATLRQDGAGLRALTQGDVLDLHPQLSSDGKRVLYQSAGQSRDPAVPWQYAPFEIVELDLASGEIRTVASDPDRDLMQPRYGADGVLWWLRTPPRPQGPSLWERLKAALLWPVHVVAGLMSLLSVLGRFSQLPGSASAGGPGADDNRLRALLLQGAVAEVPEGAPAIPPPPAAGASWELVRQAPGGAVEVVARHVIAWDLHADGRLLLTDGHAIHVQHTDGRREQLGSGEHVHLVAWLG